MKEEWKPINGYEGLYEVSNFGRIKSLIFHNGKNDRILKQRINKYGYAQVGLYHNKEKQPKTFTVHRIVASNFITNPNNYNQVNHIDGNKTNNNVNNLQWCNSKINNRHRVYVLKRSGLPLGKQVQCIETGECFKSIRQAERKYGCLGLGDVINHKKGHLTYAGLHWKQI